MLNSTYSGNRVPGRTKWFYSSIGIFRDACAALVSLYLITYIQYSGILTRNVSGSGAKSAYIAMFSIITIIVIAYRIFDGLNDPIMGMIIEKAHLKSGKFKPWILIGGATNSVCIFALFVAPYIFLWLCGWIYVIWFAVFYLLWGLTFTINDIAYWGMLPSLTSEETQRTKITTLCMIFCSIGQFAISGLLPILTGKYGYSSYVNVSIMTALLLALSSLVGFIGIKERDREDYDDKKTVTFKGTLAILKNNSQVRVMAVVLFLFNLASSIVTGLGINYFYFAVDYSHGSFAMTFFIVAYAFGALFAQGFYNKISSKFTHKQILKFSVIVCAVCMLSFFVYGLPIGNNIYLSPSPVLDDKINILYMIPLLVLGFAIFFAASLFNLTIIIMMSNTIEYNDYKFGQRNEAIIFALKPLTNKLSSACQQGILYLFLIFAGLYGLIKNMGEVQNDIYLGMSSVDDLGSMMNSELGSVLPWQVFVFKIGLVIVPLILFFICYFLIKKKYIIDELTYKQICQEIKLRNANGEVKAND